MNLKWLFGTGLLAIVIFFSAVYLGMKYNWITGSNPSTTNSNTQIKLTIDKNKEVDNQRPKVTLENSDSSAGLTLIDEEIIEPVSAIDNLGSSDLAIEDIVAQCQRLSQSVGIPESKLEQAIIECVDRNSGHLTTEKPVDDERDQRVREQCNIAITQKDLLSSEEIKMLVDECVASMTTE